MSAASASDNSSTEPEFSGVAIREAIDIQTNPAERLAQLDGWEELREGVANDRDWEDLDGVGPSTAETLDELSPEDLPEAVEPAGPDAAPEEEPDIDQDDASDDAGEEGADEDVEEGTEEAVDEPAGDDEAEDEEAVDLYDIERAPPLFKAMVKKERIAPVFDSISYLVDEVKLRVGDDRLSIRAVDPANVGMVDLDMGVRAFESYQSEPGVIGLNLDRMNDILSTGNKGDIVTFDLNPDTRKLEISVGNIEYTMALIDPASIRQEPDLPDLELGGEIEMEGRVLSRAVNASDMVSEHMSIRYDQDTTIIEADGDTDDVRLDLANEDNVESIDNADEGYSIFSLDYLKNFDKMVSKSEIVTLEHGHEFPLKLHFGLAEDHVEVEGMLAPRIQSD